VVTIAKILKAKCIEQQKEPQDADFPEILEICGRGQSASLLRDLLKDASATFRKQKLKELENQRRLKPSPPKPLKMGNGILQKRTFQRKDQMMVPKPPLVDFPTEIYNGLELEVATARDYFTIFSAAGQKLTNDLPDAWLEDRTEALSASLTSEKGTDVPEDGNVDYCQYCRTPGDIICCDFCPRAFHLNCMKKAGSPTDTTNTHNDRWECYICRKEKDPLDDDLVDGKKSMDLITPFFMTVDPTNETYLNGVEVLSTIHDMITKLMDYDFGYMFSEPVDVDAVPDYKLIVKDPIDLGTICSMLINGDYYKPLAEDCSMDDIVAKVLKDIELVWHNCFTYNYEGSAVYRMAEVLRRRATMIRKRSFNHKLSEKVKRDVEKFVLDMGNVRASILKGAHPKEGRVPQEESFDKSKEKIVRSMKPSSKNKITLKSWNPKISRFIAVLDPVSGRVVHAYGTTKSAAQAVQILLDSGHLCEWNAKSGINLKLVAEKSGSDPSSLLFGYRWVFLDDLRAQKVAFLKPSPEIVELLHKQCTYAFQTVEEALSYPDLPKNLNIRELRDNLNNLPRRSEWTEIAGMPWRRPVVPDANGTDYLDDYEDGTNNMQIEPLPKSDSIFENNDSGPWKKCSILKKDLVTNRYLVGFQHVSLAYVDWMQTMDASPTVPATETRSIGRFKKFYVFGDRNVDGIVWETNDDGVESSTAAGNGTAQLQSKPGIAEEYTQNLEQSMDITDDSRKRKRNMEEEANSSAAH
jgi:hypothetical protein